MIDGIDARSASALLALFREHEARVTAEPLGDFARLGSSSHPYCIVAPHSIGEAADIVRVASSEHIRLRLRGAGHALNGSSLPQPGELVFDTRNLQWVRYERLGTVTSGAGLQLWALRDLVRHHGYTLPVVNDGYAGPSVGGYLAAGGFGPGSRTYGAFWENVAEVVLLTPTGFKRVTRRDALFPWLFGAMGQLGAIVELTLDLISNDPNHPGQYPKFHSESDHTIKETAAKAVGPPPEEANRRLYWFTLFVGEAALSRAQDDLSELEAQHAGVFEYRDPYCYRVQHRDGVVAPLVYPAAEDFYAVGSWGFHADASAIGLMRLNNFEAEFMQMVLLRGYRRYIQSERVSGPETYRRYFAPEILARFEDLKRRIDPWSMFNAGCIFPCFDN